MPKKRSLPVLTVAAILISIPAVRAAAVGEIGRVFRGSGEPNVARGRASVKAAPWLPTRVWGERGGPGWVTRPRPERPRSKALRVEDDHFAGVVRVHISDERDDVPVVFVFCTNARRERRLIRRASRPE